MVMKLIFVTYLANIQSEHGSHSYYCSMLYQWVTSQTSLAQIFNMQSCYNIICSFCCHWLVKMDDRCFIIWFNVPLCRMIHFHFEEPLDSLQDFWQVVFATHVMGVTCYRDLMVFVDSEGATGGLHTVVQKFGNHSVGEVINVSPQFLSIASKGWHALMKTLLLTMFPSHLVYVAFIPQSPSLTVDTCMYP